MYRFRLGDLPVECDTLEELKSASGLMTRSTKVGTKAKKVSPSQRANLKKSWETAKKYAKAKGISIVEARSQLAKAKAKAKAK